MPSADILKIINLFGDRNRYAGQIKRAHDRETHFWKYYFDDFIKLDSDGGLHHIDREKLDETAQEIFSGKYHAAACDSPDALLLQYYAAKKGYSLIPFIINEVDMFEMAGWVRRFIMINYGDDPLEEFILSCGNNWMHIIGGRRDYYLGRGISESNLFYLPMCAASIEFVFPDFFAGADADRESEFAGKILAAGLHDRDYATLVRAAEIANVEVHVITNLDVYEPVESTCVTWHDSVPEDEYVRAMRDAKTVVVPLIESRRAAGQLACAIPMKFGTPVITPACESTADHVEDGVTGYNYETGSAESLAKVLSRVNEEANILDDISAGAKEHERELSRIAGENIEKLKNNIRKR